MRKLFRKGFLFCCSLFISLNIIAQSDSLKATSAKIDSNVLVVINGKVTGTIRELKKDINSIVPADMIQSINILNGENAVLKYGEKGKSGVIEIALKSTAEVVEKPKEEGQKAEDENKIFDKVEVEASFPGGEKAWRSFLEKNLNANTPVDNGAPTGRYTIYIQFIVDRQGKLTDLKPLTNYGYGMEKETIRVLKLSPDWLPAVQNGRPVKAYRRQPFIFIISKGKP